MVVPTQEELSIATQSLEVCGYSQPSAGPVAAAAPQTLDKDAVMLPKQLQYNMAQKAKGNIQHLVFPEGEDIRIVEGVGRLLARGICKATIIGPPALVAENAKKSGVSLEGAKVLDPANSPIDDLVTALSKARSITPQQATDMIRGDATWFGTMMMYLGQIDGMVSGAVHSTGDTMRPALQVIKAAPGVSQVSSMFFMLLPDGVKLFSDCGLIPNPTTDQLAEIAMQTAQTARAFGIAPRIAMMSYATGDADKGELIEKVREATRKAKALGPQELIEGPIQYDAAVNPGVAATKFKGKVSPVAGKASVCIFPNLDAGNIAYKTTQQSSKCIAIGPIMQGLRMPVNDLSRGCTVEDVVEAAVVTCCQSIAAKKAAPASKL
jgi:phosphate acetyltransferase